MIVVTNRGSMAKHVKHARKHDGSRNVSRLKRIQQSKSEWRTAFNSADTSRSRSKHTTGGQKYTWQVIMLVAYGAQLTTYSAKLNLELNLPFLRRVAIHRSTRKSLMSGLRRRLHHRRSTLQINGGQCIAQQTVCVRPSIDLATQGSH